MQTPANSSTGHDTIDPRKETTASTLGMCCRCHVLQVFGVGARPDEPDEQVRGTDHEPDDDQLADGNPVADDPPQPSNHGNHDDPQPKQTPPSMLMTILTRGKAFVITSWIGLPLSCRPVA